jgi:hypothetical protein
MMVRLDLTSRATISRFGLKLCISALIAALSQTAYLLTLSGWLALYAIVTVVTAMLLQQPFSRQSLSHWDEATWLTTTSLGLWALYKATQ